MKDKEIKIPPFVQDYLDKLDGNGFTDFVKLSAEYQKEKEDYPVKFATQSAYQNEFNRQTGLNHKLNYEDGLESINARFKQRVYQTAKQHGYKGPDPNQPSDKEFTKQGEKFQGMIDQARQRQESQTMQASPKQEATQGQEKKNIAELKEHQPYKQNTAKVEFKEMAQPDNREQERAAFLEKIKSTREQLTQRQQDIQPES